jgi:signal transduction histidine kinase
MSHVLSTYKRRLLTPKRWWEKAAEQGYTNAQYYLGNAYWKERDNENPNQEPAIKWWQKAAEQGHLIAQYKLGIAYKNGLGVTKDYEKALQWLRKVAEPDNDPLVILAGGSQNEMVRKSAYEALLDIEKIRKFEEQKKANQELEDIMAMFAHKFRGPLRSIRNNIEYDSPKQATLESVQTMSGLINIFSIIGTDAQILCEQLQQDRQGNGTLLTVLMKSLSLAIEQLLSIGNIEIISQHYFNYAKKTGQVSMTTTSDEWEENGLVLEKQLQASWLSDFKQLDYSDLEVIKTWIEARFFPLDLIGFNDNKICFAHYKAKESILLVVMTEIILNAIKYYSSETNEPIKISWQQNKVFCGLVCENPSTREERELTKGSYKGHIFLNIIAQKLKGQFPEPLLNNSYRVEWQAPVHLFITEEK